MQILAILLGPQGLTGGGGLAPGLKKKKFFRGTDIKNENLSTRTKFKEHYINI